MGYGEYIGGGSVVWRVKHGKPTHANTNGHGGRPGGHGRDEDGTNSRFRVYVNGVLQADVDCNTSRVLVVWGDDLTLQRANTNNMTNEEAIADVANDTELSAL